MSDERKSMTDEELAEIKGRLAAITEWPWIVFCRTGVRHRMGVTNKRLFDDSDAPEVLDAVELGEDAGGIKSEADAAFIANAPTDIARLLAEVERLNKVSRYLAENLVRQTSNRKKYVGAEDAWGLGFQLYKTREEAIQSWIDKAERETNNAE